MILHDHDLTKGASGPIGGKAEGLARLLRLGARLPPFFVLPPGEDPEAAVAAWRERGWARAAVRSSAMGEDSAAHSFAGMYETILGVADADGLRAAVARCRASAEAPRVAAYRAERGLPPTPVAVIVQEMVEGDASGVLFTTDPLDPDRALISAAWGLGEGVVQGTVPADVYRVDGEGRVETWLADKDAAVVLTEGGPAEQPVPLPQRQRPALTMAQAAALAGTGKKLAIAFKAPLDIEWTRRGEELVLLQARPITRPLPAGKRLLWDNSNIIESYHGLTGPLTYSFARNAYTIVYQIFCEVMGVERAVIRANAQTFQRMIGLVRGRIYYNLNAWYTVVSLLPGYRFNRRFLEQMMGVSEVAGDRDAGLGDAAPTWGQKLADVPRLVRLSGRLAWRSLRLDKDIARFFRTFDAAVEPYEGRELDDLDPHALLDLYARLEQELLWAWSTPVVNDFFVMISHGMLRSLCAKWIPGGEGLHNALLSGGGGIISTAPAQEAIKLAELIAKDQDLSRRFHSGLDDRSLLIAIRAHPRIGTAFAGYLHRLGDRCADELKLEVETLRHHPERLVRTLRGYLAGEVPAPGGEDAPRQEAEAKVEAALTGARRWAFQKVLAWARKRVAARENLRFQRTRIFGIVREIFRALGLHMEAAGALRSRRDVFWLTVDEALGWVRGTTITADLAGLAALRAAEYERWKVEDPPADRFYTWGPVWANNAFLGKPASSTSGQPPADGRLAGTPAFPGQVEGRVRKITDPDAQSIEEGEILVAYRTDPGWTPLFPRARAILVERGSLLSHSAVVARELGIPTVVGVAGLTAGLETGDVVRVDAAAGRIEVLERAAR